MKFKSRKQQQAVMIKLKDTVRDVGFPTTSTDYDESHKFANKIEKQVFGEDKFNELNRIINKKIPDGELAGTHEKDGHIEISKKIPERFRSEVLLHELVEKEKMSNTRDEYIRRAFDLFNKTRINLDTKKFKVTFDKIDGEGFMSLRGSNNIRIKSNVEKESTIIEGITHELSHSYQQTQDGINDFGDFGRDLYPDEIPYKVREFHAYAISGLVTKKYYNKKNFNKDELWIAKRHNIKIS